MPAEIRDKHDSRGRRQAKRSSGAGRRGVNPVAMLANPVVMFVLYYFVIVPIGIAMQLAGRDRLRLRRDPAAPSYWLERNPPGPAPASMKRQS
ncbi:MAG TPA: hypothetical protein VL985_06755 [Stellaceae bacterium]|nr:hypothetical protein [Stellaceae bacterium]